MNLSHEGAMELIGHEGIVLTHYLDSVGVWTIGVGHTRAAGPPYPETFLGEISVAECFRLFEKDVGKYVAAVNAALKVKVTQAQFDALVSFHFNTGAIGRASLVQRINAGDIDGAAKGFMAWNKPSEIIPRRTKEQQLFATGRYANGGMATIYPATPNGTVLWNKGRQINLRKALSVGATPPPPDVPKPTGKPPAKPPVSTAKKTGGILTVLAAIWAAISTFAQAHPIITGGGVVLALLLFLAFLLTQKKD